MTPTSTLSAEMHDLAVADLQENLTTRSVGQFAIEARLDGESLHQTLERYEVDYAWHVLGSDRLRDQTLTVLEARLERAANDAQKACVTDILRAAAAGQGDDRLMSFDNDVADRLATHLCSAWKAQAVA